VINTFVEVFVENIFFFYSIYNNTISLIFMKNEIIGLLAASTLLSWCEKIQPSCDDLRNLILQRYIELTPTQANTAGEFYTLPTGESITIGTDTDGLAPQMVSISRPNWNTYYDIDADGDFETFSKDGEFIKWGHNSIYQNGIYALDTLTRIAIQQQWMSAEQKNANSRAE
jgi:hypothetical protein